MAYFIVILSVVMQSVFIPCVTFLIAMLSVITLNAALLKLYGVFYYAEWRCAEWRCAEWRCAEWRCAEWR